MKKIDDTTKTALDELLKEDDNAISDSELAFVVGGAVKTKTPTRKTKRRNRTVTIVDDTTNTAPDELL